MVMHDNFHILATLSSTEIPVLYCPSNVQLKYIYTSIHNHSWSCKPVKLMWPALRKGTTRDIKIAAWIESFMCAKSNGAIEVLWKKYRSQMELWPLNVYTQGRYIILFFGKCSFMCPSNYLHPLLS